MMLRMRAVDMVEDAGYTPLEALDTDEAVAILESRSDIALMCTDIQLPGSTGSGWVEFDPTNGIVGNRDLIRVAVARIPSQAIPLFGTYWGSREDELGMNVEVNVKTASALL